MCENYKNNLNFINIYEYIVRIEDIYRIYMELIDENKYLTIEGKKINMQIDYTYNLNDEIILAAVNDTINNTYDNFAISSLHEIVVRKLFIYLTIEICYNYCQCFNIPLYYKDVDLESLISDCSEILCKFDLYEKNGFYFYDTKHESSIEIGISYDVIHAKDLIAEFRKMYEDWHALKELVENFEVY